MLLRRTLLPALLVAALVPIGSLPAEAAPGNPAHKAKKLTAIKRSKNIKAEFDAHSVLVRFKPGASAAARERGLKSHGASVLRTGSGFVTVKTTGSAPDLVRELRKDPAVAAVSLNYKRHLTAKPNDEVYVQGYQKHIDTLRLPQAWDVVKDATKQVIAVVDTGVDTGHPDLKSRIVPGYNAVDPNQPPTDYTPSETGPGGHGTMVAGLAAASTNNGQGIAGAAFNGKIMPVKVFQPDDGALDEDIIEGVLWAAQHGAKVINLSLGGSEDDPVLHQAIIDATALGAVVVVAAGNSGNDTVEYPGSYPEVLAVGATDNNGTLTEFSTFGDWVDVAAPGFDLVSTYPRSSGWEFPYAINSGTSFSAPIVSGIAALVRTKYPNLTPVQVIDRIKATARDAGPRGLDPYYGAGFVDAFRAVGGAATTNVGQAALGTGEPNNTPARATALTGTVTGGIEREGDIDFYRYTNATARTAEIKVTPSKYDAKRAGNFDPIITVYDAQHQVIGEHDWTYGGSAEQYQLKLAAGTYYIAVRSYNGAIDTRAYTVAVSTKADALFAPPQVYGIGEFVESTAIGDVTGDGRDDVVITSPGGPSTYLAVFPQTANRVFTSPSWYETKAQRGEQPGISLTDIDGDGLRDVVLATKAGVEVFGNITKDDKQVFGSRGLLAGATNIDEVVATDIDADGDTDLVASGGSAFTVFTRQGDGTFAASKQNTTNGGKLAVGNFDADDRQDVVRAAGTGVRVSHRTDSGWNETTHNSGLSAEIAGLTVADVNGDGRADVIGAGGDRVSVLTQAADGALKAPQQYTVAAGTTSVRTGDVNGDGRIDVISAGLKTVNVLLQKSDGTLATPTATAIKATSPRPKGLTVGDFNGDGQFDAILGGNDEDGLTILRNMSGVGAPGEKLWVSDASPSDYSADVTQVKIPTVTFTRDLDAASVTGANVQLLDGRNGTPVDAAVTYDPVTKTATITPTKALADTTPYRIAVGAVKDTGGKVNATPFSATFKTTDVPPPVTGFTATGGRRGVADLTWALPTITDLDKVIIRVAIGAQPPASPTAGTAVYSGTGTSVHLTGINSAKVYRYRAWIKDKSGKFSAGPAVRIAGSKLTGAATPATITAGATVTVTGKLVRTDNNAVLPGQTVQLLAKNKTATVWDVIGTATTSTTGTVSLTHQPTQNLDYQWAFAGSAAGFLGAGGAILPVGVKPAVTGQLSATTVALGQSVTLTGGLTPVQPGRTLKLQRLVNGAWTDAGSVVLGDGASYTFTITPTARGTFSYRAAIGANTAYTAGNSPTVTLTVT